MTLLAEPPVPAAVPAAGPAAVPGRDAVAVPAPRSSHRSSPRSGPLLVPVPDLDDPVVSLSPVPDLPLDSRPVSAFTLTVRCWGPEHAEALADRLESLGIEVYARTSNLVQVLYDGDVPLALKVASHAVAGGYADTDVVLALLDEIDQVLAET